MARSDADATAAAATAAPAVATTTGQAPAATAAAPASCTSIGDKKGDASVAQCQPWCKVAQRQHHCQWCKCRACEFCSEATAANTSSTS